MYAAFKVLPPSGGWLQRTPTRGPARHHSTPVPTAPAWWERLLSSCFLTCFTLAVSPVKQWMAANWLDIVCVAIEGGAKS